MFSRNFSIRKVSFAIPKKFSFLEREEFGRNTSNSVRLFARFDNSRSRMKFFIENDLHSINYVDLASNRLANNSTCNDLS